MQTHDADCTSLGSSLSPCFIEKVDLGPMPFVSGEMGA